MRLYSGICAYHRLCFSHLRPDATQSSFCYRCKAARRRPNLKRNKGLDRACHVIHKMFFKDPCRCRMKYCLTSLRRYHKMFSTTISYFLGNTPNEKNAGLGAQSRRISCTFQIRIVPSSEDETRPMPPAVKASFLILSLCPCTSAINSPLSPLQSLM